jgi:hypothetical protein
MAFYLKAFLLMTESRFKDLFYGNICLTAFYLDRQPLARFMTPTYPLIQADTYSA